MDARHYVPILKGKQAELGALREAAPAVKAALTPLIEVQEIPWDWEHECPARTLDRHLDQFVEQLGRAWEPGRPFFLDGAGLGDESAMSGGEHPLEYIFRRTREAGLSPVPVLPDSSEPHYERALYEVVRQGGLGACFRFQTTALEEVGWPVDEVAAVCGQLDLAPADVDLLFDFRSLQSGAPMLLVYRCLRDMIRRTDRWRSVIFAATATPRDLSEVPANGMVRVPRTEWLLWRRLRDAPTATDRQPTFGDYTIVHPDVPDRDPRLLRISVNLRYTAQEHWLLAKGEGVRRGDGYEGFPVLCQRLLREPEYRGPAFSWGDGYISRCAAGEVGPGTAMIWKKIGISHHLATVTDQLATLADS